MISHYTVYRVASYYAGSQLQCSTYNQRNQRQLEHTASPLACRGLITTHCCLMHVSTDMSMHHSQLAVIVKWCYKRRRRDHSTIHTMVGIVNSENEYWACQNRIGTFFSKLSFPFNIPIVNPAHSKIVNFNPSPDLVDRFHHHQVQSVARKVASSPDQRASMCEYHELVPRHHRLSDWHSVSTKSFDFCTLDIDQNLRQRHIFT